MEDVSAQQQRHLRRILISFLVVVVLLPLVALGGTWSLVLIPLLLVGSVALREAMALRRSVREHGAQARPPREP